MTIHARSTYLGRSRIGVPVFSSLCGLTDSLHSQITVTLLDVDCKRCLAIAAQIRTQQPPNQS